ncbi:5727_t:CDS:2, partial [Scutellospora calospora]
MIRQKRTHNNDSSDSDTESRNSSSSKSGGHPLTGVWKYFERGQSKGDGHWEGTCKYCKKFYPRAKLQTLRAHLANSCKHVPEEWQRHFNYIIINNLDDIPTDEPISDAVLSLVKRRKKDKQSELTNWFDSTKIEISRQSMIDKAIALAFIMCSIPFHVINNPFFVNALKLLNPGYSVLSREILSGRLLDTEVAKVIDKVNKILDSNNHLTIAYKGIGLKFGTFPSIASYARTLWKQIGKTKESCEALITQLRIYKEQKEYINGTSNPYHRTRLDVDRLEGLVKVYRFNLSNPTEQLHHTQIVEITPDMMMNITETVFKEIEEKSTEDDDIEMLNPTKDLYSNEQDLDLSISTFIDLKSS